MTTVPAVLSALTDGFKTVLPGPSFFTVAEGGLGELPGKDFLVVGWDQDDQVPAVSGTWAAYNAAANTDREEYDVLCMLGVWTDRDGIRSTRNKAFDYLGAMKTWLTANNDLGLDGVTLARISGQFTFAQPIAGESSTANLRFPIHVTALTS